LSVYGTSQRSLMWRLFASDYSAARTWLLAAAILLLFGVTMGLILALQFVFPDLFRGIAWLVFGRLRQAHTNTVLFAWLSPGMIAMWYYIVPQLTGRKIWSEVLGNILAIGWMIAVMVGVGLIMAGHTQSREYAEMVWGVDVVVEIALWLNLINLYMTIANRVEPKLYVSLWYISGTLIWFPILYFIGNVMWKPPTGALTGIDDAIFHWFYGHNVLGLWFTTGLLPVMYYIIPRETRTPLYSHYLSLFAFWGIAVFYTGVGGHHLEWAPIPYWLKTMAVAESIGMIIVITAFFMNLVLTMRGNWNRLWSSIPLRFVFTGFLAYILGSFQGSHEAIRSINLLTHFTQYVPGHAHLNLLFFSAVTIMGGAYYIIPRIYKCQIYSRTLANVQYATLFIGFSAFFAGFTLVGVVQGADWVHGGLPVWPVLPTLRPYMALRAAGGAVLWTNFIMFTYNIFATVLVRRPVPQVALPAQPALRRGPVAPTPTVS
jgi:cbb3-type cytochrome c oxidase subunit I